MPKNLILILLPFLFLSLFGAACYEDTVLQSDETDPLERAFIVSSTDNGAWQGGAVKGEEDPASGSEAVQNGEFDENGVNELNEPVTNGLAK